MNSGLTHTHTHEREVISGDRNERQKPKADMKTRQGHKQDTTELETREKMTDTKRQIQTHAER